MVPVLTRGQVLRPGWVVEVELKQRVLSMGNICGRRIPAVVMARCSPIGDGRTLGCRPVSGRRQLSLYTDRHVTGIAVRTPAHNGTASLGPAVDSSWIVAQDRL